ncbi:hypothetical protein G4X40_08710 [Rhodococcus sp. D2-41]|uniref:DUF5593 domain-containing protein n=1 Tax=Speluncibacter jeojiensis TaxID=2710754 RepID=A0A9X4M0H3_9ACTN|nr:GAF domain-containing protein [Rhodococcus sp. D2-41]MDG3010231.1 hypothetical protein [Rhodococcus sp. D2-41]MDG3015744.1 DUF5593 domain-containing protein [Corynebacteriales bacterium D3-21]
MPGSKWLLVETLGGEPSIVGWGNAPQEFESLTAFRRTVGSTPMVIAARVIVEMLSDENPREIDSIDNGHRVIARPLPGTDGQVQGLQLWIGLPDEPVPPRPPAGAWVFDVTAGTASGSDDLFDLYGTAPERRRGETALAGAFTRLLVNSDHGEALAKIVAAGPGAEHQAVWTVSRDDGQRRAAHFSCRIFEEETEAGGHEHHLLRGITHDIGPAEDVPPEPVPVVLECRVLEATAGPGEFRAVLNPRTLRMIRWIDDPMPGVAWENNDGEPEAAIHPDDLPTARRMLRSLIQVHGDSTGSVRVRRLDGGWQPLAVRLGLMPLTTHTMATLVTMRALD